MMEILFEDNHLLALYKPGGLLTQPTDQEADSLENRAKDFIKQRDQKPGNVFLVPVHRLDRPVSGIVLFAKTSKALARLNESMRARSMQKTYQAIVEGQPAKKEAMLIDYLYHDEYKAFVCKKSHPEAKEARLRYKTLKSTPESSLLEITLETGRYHQIRVQCAHMGHPIVGDVKYGSKKSLPGGKIALQHTQLKFEHPVTKEEVIIQSALNYEL